MSYVFIRLIISLGFYLLRKKRFVAYINNRIFIYLLWRKEGNPSVYPGDRFYSPTTRNSKFMRL